MMPDYIKITHQPKTMATPTISAALDTFEQAANRGTCVYLSPNLVQELRAALKAEPRGQRPSEKDLYDLAAEFNGDPVPAMRRALELWGNPLQGAPAPGGKLAAVPTPQPEGDWFTVATIAQDMRSRGLAEQMAGDRLLELANGNRSQPARTAAPPEPETPAETLAVRPLLERVAQLGDVIGRQTVAQVQQLANQAAVWLRENPPGQLVAIEPRGCPTPGACSCVEPTSPSPAAPPALVPPALVPVAWCRSDEFANSMNRGGSFNGWKDPGAGANKCDMQLYAIPCPAPPRCQWPSLTTSGVRGNRA